MGAGRTPSYVIAWLRNVCVVAILFILFSQSMCKIARVNTIVFKDGAHEGNNYLNSITSLSSFGIQWYTYTIQY